MSNTNIISYSPKSHPHLWLPADPFPYPFEDRGLKATLKDFLKVVREHPAYVEPTHAAFHRLFVREGVSMDRSESLLRMTGKEIPSYASCNNFFGIEESINAVVTSYGYQAAEGGRARKKALAITGAPGGGKSDFVNHIQYNVMRKREPIPFLAGSPMWSNPMNALFLVKLIASKKSARRRDAMVAEIIRIIDSLDFTGSAELDYTNSDVAAIAKKHGYKAGEKLNNEQLADIVMKSEKDFVAVVCFGLGLPKATVDALVMPDPWAQDVVLGEFFGPALISHEVMELAGLGDRIKVGKEKKDEKYGRFDADYAIDLCNFPIDNMFMSEGQGLVDVAEVQPINFDLDVLRGSKDIGAIGRYDDRDPRTVSPSGIFNKGKLIIGTEFFRNPDEAFRVLLEALEGQRLSLPDPLGNYHQQGVGWEGMIVVHSNDEQWNKFWSNPAHRAHNDRLVWVSWKYPLEPNQSSLVTDKLYNMSVFGRASDKGGVHREPVIRKYVGLFRTATTLDWASKGNLPFMSVLRALDGETVRQSGMGTEIDLRALREKAPWDEGLNGMSPREMDSIMGELAANARKEFEAGLRASPGFTCAELRDHMIAKFKKDPRIDQKTRDKWVGWLEGPLEREFRRVELSKVYRAAFIPQFGDLCQQFFGKYLEYVRSLNRSTPRQGTSGGQYMTSQQMEQFLQDIERADLGVNSAQADKFRTNVMVAVDAYKDEHGVAVPPYTCHEGLRRCIEAYVLRQAKDITGVIGLSNLTQEEKDRLDSAKARLIKEHGYDEYTAEKLLVEVAMTRDFLTA
jgi:predicted Ser/Thr protein kinase